MTARAVYLASTTQGVERELAAELTELGAVNVRPDVGKCFFEAGAATALCVLHAGRTMDKVQRVVARGRIETLEDVRRLARDVDWPAAFAPSKPFAVRGTRLGDHAFTSMEAAGVVGEAVIDRFVADEGERPPVRLNAPEVEVQLLVRDDEALLSLNLAGASLHKRGWRVASHQAPLKPTLAAALLRFSGWPELGFPALLDPTTGSGTIPVEAALMARRVPPGVFRLRHAGLPERQPGVKANPRADPGSRNAAARVAGGLPAAPENAEAAWFDATHRPTGYLFQHLHGYPLDVWEKVRARADAGATDDAFAIAARDVKPREVEVAERNAASAGVADTVRFTAAGVADLEPDPVPRVIVANPPYGVRLGSPAVVRHVNRGLADLVRRAGKEGPVTAAFISGDAGLPEVMGQAPVATRRVRYGELTVHLLRYELA